MYQCSICSKEVNKAIHTKGMDTIAWNDFYHNHTGDVCFNCFIAYSGVETLYHLSLEQKKIFNFEPRVSENISPDEDDETPRICVSHSIEGALSAVPWGGIMLKDNIDEQDEPYIRVYEFNVSNIKKGTLLPPDYLFQSGKVMDAYENDEYWIIAQAEPTKTYLIEIVDYEEDSADCCLYEDLVNPKTCVDGKLYSYSINIISDVKYKIVA